MMKKIIITLLGLDVLLLLYLSITRNYLYAILIAIATVLLLFFYGKLSAGWYIENIILVYIKNKGTVSKQEIIDYLEKETQNKLNISIDNVVDDIIFRLMRKQLITVSEDRISIK